MKFTEFGLNEELVEAISYMNFTDATPIQEQAIPIILAGNDLIGCAQTGTGKTAAFLLPVLDSIMKNKKEGIKVLIVVPTRELALQIDQQIEAISYGTDISHMPIYGGGDGADFVAQKKGLVRGADIVIATPGKLLSHLHMQYVIMDNLTHLILDEADRMLDIGFHDDILKILSFVPKDRQNLMFSATMPDKIRTFAKKILNNPKEINIAMSKPAEGVLQVAYLVYDRQKIELITHLIQDKPDYKSILIFSSTKKNVHEIVRALKRTGIAAEGMSSMLEQKDREKLMLKFRARKVRVLVATDVISRGIDIQDISLVINYHVPKDPEDYVHRVGRTARAESTGVAITFVNAKDMYSFDRIEKLIGIDIVKVQPPKELGPGPSWELKRSAGQKGRRYNKKGRSGGSKGGRGRR